MSKSPLTDYLFEQPATPKQKALDDLNRLELMMLDAADTLRSIKRRSDLKSLCNECLKDIALAKNILNNWDSVEGANDLIKKVNFNCGRLWTEYALLLPSKVGGSIGGQATAANKAIDLKDRNEKIKVKAKQLVGDGIKTSREVAGCLAREYNLTSRQIRTILKNTEA